MTEAEARHILRTGTSRLSPGEREWLAAQAWRAASRGWSVAATRDGISYHVDRDPHAAPHAPEPLFVVRRQGSEGLGGIWVEPRLPMPPRRVAVQADLFA